MFCAYIKALSYADEGCLEGQTHGEMEGEIAFKVGIEQRIMLARGFVGRVNGLHAEVETQNEVVEVKSKTQSVGQSDLSIEAIEAELSAWLIGIIAQSPDVTCINKHRPM